jgi:integrase/recombinase XerD
LVTFVFIKSNIKNYAKKTEVLQRASLNEEATVALSKLHEVMTVGNYSPKSILNYMREMRFIFQYYNHLSPKDITADHISTYILYIKEVHASGHDKCRMVAHSVAFFFRHVQKQPYSIPSKLYPRKEYRLPDIMSQEEVRKIFSCITNLKHRALIQTIYSSGIRLQECINLKLSDVDSTHMRLKVRQGKGKKDRYTILSHTTLSTLRAYYKQYKPKEYLFNGIKPGNEMAARSIQHCFLLALKKAGLSGKDYSIHTLRHSFATHLLDSGTDIHTIKELLGHSKLETTMVYLHLQAHKRFALVSPLDSLYTKNDLEQIPVHQSQLCPQVQ